MMNDTVSRGQKQRIMRRLDKLSGKTSDGDNKKDNEGEKKLTAKEKIDLLLKKRENKLANKEKQKKAKGLN
jgi:hypothetical protein